jgi:nitrogen regulatory protein PII
LTIELLVLVIDRGDKLDSILSGFVELGVTGATVIESQGMARRLSEESATAPVFAGLQELLASSRPQSTTVFSVIETQEKLDAAVEMIQERCGDMTNPGTGIVFTLPVSRAVGLASALRSEHAR